MAISNTCSLIPHLIDIAFDSIFKKQISRSCTCSSYLDSEQTHDLLKWRKNKMCVKTIIFSEIDERSET